MANQKSIRAEDLARMLFWFMTTHPWGWRRFFCSVQSSHTFRSTLPLIPGTLPLEVYCHSSQPP